MSKIKLNVVRTSKDIIFDCVFLALTIAIWGIIAWLISRAPDIVPTHFGPSGKPDAYGSPTFITIALRLFDSAFVIARSATGVSVTRRLARLRKRYTPSTPLVDHGFTACSGPMNIS